MRWHFSARFSAFRQERLAEFFQRIGELVIFALFLRPGADLVDPLALVAAVELAAIDTRVFQQRFKIADRSQPLLFDVANLREDLLMA